MALNISNSSVAEIAELLDKTRWADEFSWDQILKISEYLILNKAVSGDIIYDEGDKELSMAIIAKGVVDIIKVDEAGNESVIAQLHSSQSMGEMSLIDGEPRSARAVANTDVILLTLGVDKFNQCADKMPGLSLKLLWKLARMVSQRLRKTNSNLVDLLNK
ncbi:MAG: cyclic nucleotide-binding domain-containing protein [Gammaproteobacteria bacterium]|nr:cyclic nucleotide-binding domain-containing protein [Gammaproteobacteria bacterium]